MPPSQDATMPRGVEAAGNQAIQTLEAPAPGNACAGTDSLQVRSSFHIPHDPPSILPVAPPGIGADEKTPRVGIEMPLCWSPARFACFVLCLTSGRTPPLSVSSSTTSCAIPAKAPICTKPSRTSGATRAPADPSPSTNATCR